MSSGRQGSDTRDFPESTTRGNALPNSSTSEVASSGIGCPDSSVHVSEEDGREQVNVQVLVLNLVGGTNLTLKDEDHGSQVAGRSDVGSGV